MYKMGLIFQHSVKNNNQFTHTGSESNLVTFSGGYELEIEVFDNGVEPSGGSGRHVESVSDGFATTGDHAFSTEGNNNKTGEYKVRPYDIYNLG